MHSTSSPDVIRRYEGVDPKLALLSETEAAALLQLKPSTLTNWRSSGRHNLPYVDAGKIRYRLSDVIAFMERNTFLHTGEKRLAES